MSDYMDAGIHPAAVAYYERMTTDLAVQIVAEQVGEWDYDADPHGYCHERSALIALLDAVEPGWRDRLAGHRQNDGRETT